MSGLLFHLLLTTNCDLKCRYCYGKSCDDMDADFGDFTVDYGVPPEINYDINVLKQFMRKDPQPVLIFYGGEPMLCIDKIRQIMDTVSARQFNIQTNGLHLHQLEPEYVNRFTSIFVSLDGDQKLTDYYRGNGIYKKVTDNLNLIRKNGYTGEIIARMTLMEQTDIYPQIRWLLNNPDHSFSSIHWQLDAGFWKTDFPKRQFKQWVEHSYNPQIQQLVQYWVDQMETSGKVLKLYPLLAVMQSLLLNEQSKLRCGSGWANYSIQTNGTIIPCPAMSGMKDYYLGHIQDAHPLQLKQVFVDQPCSSCTILGECGGRCLYANITKQWTLEQYGLVCKTVQNMVESLKSALPTVNALIENKTISLSDFWHLKYNSCEVIP
ncbi:MAG: TIGR04084 family radical SAM/SPASM domain-containing protein [Candidatus Bathyarchaeota archaeon]|nr:TIGR04084 family radical SAM/SPASM domain-containing protein [Candidatus Bathyarchaeota archaeon]